MKSNDLGEGFIQAAGLAKKYDFDVTESTEYTFQVTLHNVKYVIFSVIRKDQPMPKTMN